MIPRNRVLLEKTTKDDDVALELKFNCLGHFGGSGVQGCLWLYSDLEATQGPV